MVILGQTNYAKAFIVNEIFGKTILPPVDYENEAVKWRSVRFKYGDKSNIAFELPGSYELVDNLAAYNQSWQTIPQEDLEINVSEKEDLAKWSAGLEVKLCHPLLKDGGQIWVSPCNANTTLQEIYQGCTEDIVPIFIYSIVEESFSEKVSYCYASIRAMCTIKIYYVTRSQRQNFTFYSIAICIINRDRHFIHL